MEFQLCDYDVENPQIWEAFQQLSREARDRGFSNYSAKGIFELIRWHSSTEAEGIFKINNNFTAYYARKLMVYDKTFEGFFRTRAAK
jgi:hypothetical protein